MNQNPVRKIVILSVACFCLMIGLFGLFAYFDKKGTPPLQVADAIITCTQTVCATKGTSPACVQLSTAVTVCLSSGINAAACLAGVPALASVGYADVVCVVAALAATPSKPVAVREITKYAGNPENKSGETFDEVSDVQQAAQQWLRTQRVNVQQ